MPNDPSLRPNSATQNDFCAALSLFVALVAHRFARNPNSAPDESELVAYESLRATFAAAITPANDG